MNEQERKQHIRNTFDTVSPGYENPGLRFFEHAAAALPEVFGLRGDEQVLDVACGTGQAARALARSLPRGRVTGVDFSDGMLSQARAKAAALNNIEFHAMDMQAMTFAPRSFDAANCSFGLFFVEDMIGLLRDIAARVRPGGSVVATSFYDTAFAELAELFFARLEKFGIERPPVGWKRISTEARGAELFGAAGLPDMRAQRRSVGYFLRDANEWWDVIWFAGFRGLVNQLKPDALTEFKREHLADIQQRATADGIWLDVDVLYFKATVRG